MTDFSGPPRPSEPPASPPPAPPPASPPPAMSSPPPVWPPPLAGWPGPADAAPRRRSGWKYVLVSLLAVMLLGSVLVNVLLFMLVGLGTGLAGGLDTTVLRSGHRDEVVAVLHVQGVIDADTVGTIDAFCRQVGEDAKVKAVVLRVVSGGGGVSDCDQIYVRLKGLTEKKKLVVSMGGVAASGGYYISAPAHAIYAEPTTVTGSIGVIGGWPVLKGTLEKIGVNMVLVRSSNSRAWKAWENPFEQPAKYQLADLQKTIDALQGRFESIVRTERAGRVKITTSMNTYVGADNSKFTVEETVPFNGQVFLGEEAKKLGLVDDLGYLDDAIDEAQALAGLAKPKVVVYARRRSLREELGFFGSGASVNLKTLDELQTPRLLMMWKVSP